MPEILPRHYLIGIVFFTLILVAGVDIITKFEEASPGFVDQEKFKTFNKTFNQMENLDDNVDNLKEATQTDADPGLFGFLDALVGTAWSAIKSIFTSLSFMNTVFGGLYTIFGIPAYVGNLIITAITIILVFAIFTVVFQREI